MAFIVQKFGGSSVADKDRVYRVAGIIADTYCEGHDVVVVLSAQGKTTDQLIAKAHEINPEPSKREMDMLLSCGEQMSVDCRVFTCRMSMRGGALRADAELQLAMQHTLPAPAEVVCEVAFTPVPAREKADMELYYPASSQSLWDVAKRYGIPPERLCESNDLDCALDAPCEKRFLFIP